MRLITPGGFVEGIVSAFVIPCHDEGQAEIEVTFAVVGVRGLPGLFLNGFVEMPDAFFEVSASVQKKAVAVIQADVGWVAPESFQIIVFRVEGGMTVLLQMLGAQIQFLGGLKFLRRKQRICRIRSRL